MASMATRYTSIVCEKSMAKYGCSRRRKRPPVKTPVPEKVAEKGRLLVCQLNRAFPSGK